MAMLFKYLVKGLAETKTEYEKEGLTEEHKQVLNYLTNVERAKHSTNTNDIARLIKEYNLDIEHVPTKELNTKEVGLLIIC